MDPSSPLSIVAPSLSAKVLQGLAATTTWVSGAEVHRLARAGSVEGVRKVLHRLAHYGLVDADEHRHATLFRLNRDHVSAAPILELLRIRSRILELIAENIAAWMPPVVSASLFGSFARGEANAESDIDIVVIVAADSDPDELAVQVDQLAQHIVRWVGNRAHIIDITVDRLADMLLADDPLVSSWRADAIHLTGIRMLDLLREIQQR